LRGFPQFLQTIAGTFLTNRSRPLPHVNLLFFDKPFGHILRRNCVIQCVIEGKIKEGIGVKGRRGRQRRKLLDELQERRG